MRIDPEEASRVFEVARSLLPAGEAFARRVQLDPDMAQEAMMEAAKRVMELQQSEGGEGNPPRVKNLPAYLFTVYRNLMIAELRRRERELTIGDDQLITSGRDTDADTTRSLQNRILLSEIVKRMNPKSRTIFGYLVLGYSYEEIAYKFKKDMAISISAATLRSELSKAVSRIRRELDAKGDIGKLGA